jgi:hypothetical protein
MKMRLTTIPVVVASNIMGRSRGATKRIRVAVPIEPRLSPDRRLAVPISTGTIRERNI